MVKGLDQNHYQRQKDLSLKEIILLEYNKIVSKNQF